MTQPEVQNYCDPEDKPNPIEQPDESIQPDPLLDSGSFIVDPPAGDEDHTGTIEFEPGSVIRATPISMVAPDDATTPPPPDKNGTDDKTPSVKRTKDDKSERPSWLPQDWEMLVRVRESGASAGSTDRYYIEPVGHRRFRSKNEVFHFLETGKKLKKRKSTTETDAEPSGKSESQKRKKSSAKSKKSESKKSEGVKT